MRALYRVYKKGKKIKEIISQKWGARDFFIPRCLQVRPHLHLVYTGVTPSATLRAMQKNRLSSCTLPAITEVR